MSWVTVIWSMVVSACLTLALVNLLVWWRKRTAWANLLFSSTAVATAAMAFCELRMMLADTPGQFGVALSWLHVSGFVLIVSLVGFVLFYLRAGRPWLAWATCTVRAFSLLLNFLTGQNLNYREVTGLRHIPFLGESVSVGEGVSNPWMLVGQLSLLLFVVFVADAAITVWRRGVGRHVLVTGVSIVFFVLVGTVQSILVLWQIVRWPYAPSFCFLGIIAAMAYEISRETLRAAQLSDDLRESETRMTLAAEAANLGIWIRDLVRNEIWATDNWRALLGFTKSERIDFNNFLAKLHPDDRERVNQTVGKAFAGDGHYKMEYRVALPDGRMRWIASRGRVEFSRTGKPVLVRGVSMDITERKRTEAELFRERAELAHVARVSTMGELAASVAHELNQPLGAILANAEAAELFLQQDPPALDDLRAILADIRTDDERAGEVIRRMRALLRKRELEQQPLEINFLVQDVLQLVSGDAALRGVSLSADLVPILPKIAGDRVHLQQVLLNLILNGMDAMANLPRERRRISVRTRLGADDRVELAVVDSGPGIEPDKVTHLFEPFYTTKPNGMGMGLSIARTIIDAHHGHIWAENNPSGGAVFRIALPAVTEGTKP